MDIHMVDRLLHWYTSLPPRHSTEKKMVYIRASSVDIFQSTNDLHGVHKPKRRRKYVPHHMRSEEYALKRNARERRRQGRINDALDSLNCLLPQTGSGNKKCGKEDIIQRAIECIQTLSSILEQTSRNRIHQSPVELPEPSPQFNPLPEELFRRLTVEAQHWISSTQRWAMAHNSYIDDFIRSCKKSRMLNYYYFYLIFWYLKYMKYCFWIYRCNELYFCYIGWMCVLYFDILSLLSTKSYSHNFSLQHTPNSTLPIWTNGTSNDVNTEYCQNPTNTSSPKRMHFVRPESHPQTCWPDKSRRSDNGAFEQLVHGYKFIIFQRGIFRRWWYREWTFAGWLFGNYRHIWRTVWISPGFWYMRNRWYDNVEKLTVFPQVIIESTRYKLNIYTGIISNVDIHHATPSLCGYAYMIVTIDVYVCTFVYICKYIYIMRVMISFYHK